MYLNQLMWKSANVFHNFFDGKYLLIKYTWKAIYGAHNSLLGSLLYCSAINSEGKIITRALL